MKICENCNKEHDETYASGRFCSIFCSHSWTAKQNIEEKNLKRSKALSKNVNHVYIKKEFTGECLSCKQKISKKKKYCSVKCQQRYKHTEYIKRWKNGEENGITYNYTVSDHIKKYLLEKYDNKCSKCGWCEINPYIGHTILEVEHINGKADDNREDNLLILCPNCHTLTKTYKALNIGNGVRNLIESKK